MGDEFLDLDDKGEKKEDLILGKFKTPEEAYKAYENLEPEFTKKSQELADTKRALEELQTRVTATPAPTPAPSEEENLDQLFFTDPAQAMNKVVQKQLQPLLDAQFETSMTAYRTSDPVFKKYENEIRIIVQNAPHIKTQPGIVEQLYKMVKGLHIEDFEAELREKIRAEMAGKVEGALEGGGAGHVDGGKGEQQIKLTDDEKAVARKFNSNLSPEEAYKKYAAKKAKVGGTT